MIITIGRQTIFFYPLAYGLNRFFKLLGLIVTNAIADIITTLVSVLPVAVPLRQMMKKQRRQSNMELNTKKQLEAINRQIKELVGIYRGIISHSGISENEFWIWYTLIIMDGEYSQQDICSCWSLSKQTVNTIVKHMVKKGLAFLEVVPGTKNRKIIRLTDAGRAYGEDLVRHVSDAEDRAFNKLPETDLLACTVIFRKYINILKEEIYGTENWQIHEIREKK